MPGEICSGAETIAPMCYASVNFTLLYTVMAIVGMVFLFRKKLTNRIALVIFSLFSIFSCFVLADYTMRLIEQPSLYGIEWFIVLYYLWVLLLLDIFLSIILLPVRRKSLLKTAAILTFIFIFIFAETGRGNFEQITPLAGGLYAKFGWDMLWLSFSFRFFVFIAALSVIFAAISMISNWVITGSVNLAVFKTNASTAGVYFILLLVPVISIPLGDILNRKDVKEAKNYIDDIKKKVVKYYYENGEYPKFVEDMLPAGRSPRLLERHEFFTMGVRGTYYFSRADKFCFIFQNPSSDFGYYSITSERDWRYNLKTDSYDTAFINLCDESEKNFQDLISNHLGVESEDKLINELSLEAGAPVMPAPMSKESSQILQDKIIDRSKEDPTIKKYFKVPEKEEEK